MGVLAFDCGVIGGWCMIRHGIEEWCFGMLSHLRIRGGMCHLLRYRYQRWSKLGCRAPRIKKRRYGSSISSLKRVGDETKSGASIFPKAPGSSNLMWVRPVLPVCLAQVFPVRQERGAYRARQGRQGRPAFSDLRAIRLRTQGKPCRRSLPQRRIRGIFS